MAELSLKERLQPSLLDRLTDLEPDRKTESREHRVLSIKQLKQSVLRDLSWLFNSTALAAVEDLSTYPDVLNSVINYGIPALSGVNLSNINIQKLQRKIRQAIINFEPRIMANTLKIEVMADPQQMSHVAICFNIEGDLWAQPLPVRLYIRSDIDLETGEVSIKDLGG